MATMMARMLIDDLFLNKDSARMAKPALRDKVRAIISQWSNRTISIHADLDSS